MQPEERGVKEMFDVCIFIFGLILYVVLWHLFKSREKADSAAFIVFSVFYLSICILFLVLFLMPGSAPNPNAKICVSVAPLAYFAERISGQTPRVMVPPGADPHTFDPPPADLAAIETADMYVKVGHPLFELEAAWIDKQLARRSDVAVVDCSENAALIPDDPHLWLGIPEMKNMALKLADTLAKLDPLNAESYRKNAEKVVSELDALRSEISVIFSKSNRRKFLVYHPAFGYFARDFGLEQISVEKEGKEPGPRDIEDAVNIAKAEGIKTIFAQAQTDPRSAEAVAREIGGRVVQLDPLASDWPENMRRIAVAIAEALNE
jgi:zinc transport system substrate-binding protein